MKLENENPVTPEVTAPVNPVAAPEVAAPLAAAPVVPVVPPVVTDPGKTVEGLETQLATSLNAMKDLEQKIGALQGTSQDVQRQREEIFSQLTTEIQKQESLSAELADKSTKLEEASQATLTLLNEKAAVEQKVADVSQKLMTAEARATRLEVIADKYPHLMKYADYMTASEDRAVVEASCEKFQAKRNEDFESYRQTLGSVASMATVPTGNPGRAPEPATAVDLEKHLKSAMADPVEFEKRISAAIENFQSRRPST